MSKTPHGHSAKPGRRHRAVKTNRMTLARKIARDARISAETDNDETFERLCRSILTCLDSGNQAVLEEAIAHVNGDRAAREELFDTIHHLATTRFDLTNQATGERARVELFAIPVFMAVARDKRRETPRLLNDHDLDWLAKSFRQHGLASDEDSVMLLPELWQTEDIYNFPFPAVYRLTRDCVQCFIDGDPVNATWVLKEHPEAEEVPDEQVTMFLRYVIGAWLHPYGAEIPFLVEENGDQIEQWQETVAARLQGSLRCNVELLFPDTLYEAMEEGWMDFHHLGLSLQRGQILSEAGVLPAEVTAVVSVHADGGDISELRIGYFRQEDTEVELIGGTVRPIAPFEDPGELFENLFTEAEEEELGRIEVVAEVQEEKYDPDTGEPLFAAPSGSAPPPLTPSPPGHGYLH